MKIKICGLTREEDILAANEIRPDYIGFVFAAGRRRTVTPEKAKSLKALLDPAIPSVGVFVDQSTEEIAGLLKEGIIDIAQLHGNETEEQVREIKALSGKPVIKAFKVTGKEDIIRWKDSKADYLLLDAGQGCGEQFDWSLLSATSRPYFLAGGINTGNIGEALKMPNACCIDVSSGAETDGFKDPAKMRALVQAAHGFKA
ncbi:MAG: phosphoribosylanthranilate isomerase [Clostridia bacterium]|nr:phosphoribosylanthranilate isomerase [Clostridia bacterium]